MVTTLEAPADWRALKISDFASIGTGSKNTQDRAADGAYPFFVRSAVVERINSYSYESEAVLTAGDGVGTGKVFHYVRGPHEVHQRVYRISDFCNGVSGRFFFHYFRRYFFDRIALMTAKSSVDSVRKEMIADMEVPCPPLAEQEAIVQALDDAERLVDVTSELLLKKSELHTAALQELLTPHRRMPGFSGDWVRHRLGDIVRVRHGKSQRGVVSPDGPYPILATSGEIGRASAYLYDQPSVLIGRKGTIDSPQYADKPFWSIDTLFYTEVGPLADPKFIFYLFQTIPWRSYNEASGVPSLNSATIEAIEVDLPPLEEQKAVAAVLSDMQHELHLLEQQVAKRRDLSEGLAQALLSGRMRIAAGTGGLG